MKISQVTFIAKNVKCVSIKPKRYLINTSCTKEALKAAKKILSEEKHADRYRPLPVLFVEVHSV